MPQWEIPKGAKLWRSNQIYQTTTQLIAAYEAGNAGAYRDRDQDARLKSEVEDSGGNFDGESVCHSYGLAETGAGKLSLSFLPTLDLWPGSMPGPPQRRGDCVSHGQKNACLVSIAAEIMAGKPDEITGKIEGAPDVPAAGIQQGVFSTEAIYWWRDHGGDGWSCSHSARVVMHESGLWMRKPYPDFDLDLTSYNPQTAGKWGRTSPPDEIKQFGIQHRIRTATEAKSYESVRDLIANYYGINHCGSQGLGSKRDKYGVVRRSGSWAHAMSYIGVDDRPWAHQLYGCGLVLNLNSWGTSWVSGPRDIHESADMVPPALKQEWISKGIVNAQTGNIMLPEGSVWVPWKDMAGRYNVASSSFDGWPPSKLTFRGSAFG